MDEVDQLSFASILAGVQRLRDDYEVVPKARPKPATAPAPPQKAQDSPQTAEKAPTGTTQGPESLAGPSQPANLIQPSKLNRPHSALPVPARRGAPVHSYASVQVAPAQKGNPLLESPQMKLVPWTYNSQILLDYYINATAQVLFLSLKYHKLRPEYVGRRLDKLRGLSATGPRDINDEALRVLLVVVDIDSPQEPLRSLATMCIRHDMSLVVAWLFEEAGHYVAALKLNEMAKTRLDLAIQGIKKGDYALNILASLTTVRAVNKTDVANLLASCKSFKNVVMHAAADDLAGIPGLGERKSENLKAAMTGPFVFNRGGPT